MIRFALALVRRYSSFITVLRRIPAGVAGIVVGICVVLFRVCLDWVMQGSFHMTESFYLRYPVFLLFYLWKSFSLCRVNKFHQRPIIIGCLGISIEIVASMSELAFYHMLVLGTTITISEVNKLIIIAIFRSFLHLAF